MLSTIRRLSIKRSIPCRRLAADSKSPIDIPGPPPNKLFQVIRVIGAAGITTIYWFYFIVYSHINYSIFLSWIIYRLLFTKRNPKCKRSSKCRRNT